MDCARIDEGKGEGHRQSLCLHLSTQDIRSAAEDLDTKDVSPAQSLESLFKTIH